MGQRTGLGVLECAVLQAVAETGGSPGDRHLRTAGVLQALEDRHGIGARYVYPLLQDLAASWRLHLPLLDGQGNWGSPYGDPAAGPGYTEVRLSPVGALALAAERGEVGPLPLALIEGTLYRDGTVPPFAPRAVVDALLTGRTDAGPPVLPTGGTVEGAGPQSLADLLAGRAAKLVLGCTIVDEPGALVITQVPLGVAVNELVEGIAQRMTTLNHPGPRYADYLPPDRQPAPEPPAPIVDMHDLTDRHGLRIALKLRQGTDPAQARAWVRSVWPVTVTVDCVLPAPMGRRLADWDRGDGSGLSALRELL